MTTWNDRLLPHPVLTYWGDDYVDVHYNVSVPAAVLSGTKVNISVKHHLTSDYLLQLVAKGQAHYFCLIGCGKTFYRAGQESKLDEYQFAVDASHLYEVLTLAPYVVAKTDIDNFQSAEHNPEFHDLRPEGFFVRQGSILAVGKTQDIPLQQPDSPNSIIDIVADEQIPSGRFSIRLNDTRIKIHVDPNDYITINAGRRAGPDSTPQFGAALFPSLYLSAVIEGLRNLNQEDYADKEWTAVLKGALERNGETLDADSDSDTNADYMRLAQMLLDNPMGRMLTAFLFTEDQ